jgi:DNA-directed RNA polymerase alpha subunit
MIRRCLIKDLEGFKVAKKIFLVSKKFENFSPFHHINQFAMIEEVFPSLFEISSNIEIISCKSIRKNHDEFLGVISTSEYGEVTNSNIKLPKFVTIINPRLTLFRILSKNLKFKLILKFKKKRGFFFNSVQKVNYVIEGIFPYFNFVIFEIETDRSLDPLESLLSCFPSLNKHLFVL